MAYTLTQARGLLTAAELALFDQSRAEPIKALKPAALRSKVTRARALRDKYRDLYRRQTVATRGSAASKRSATGGDNERTQRKADILGEVLVRFEARLQVVEVKVARETAALAKAKAAKAAAKPVKVAKPAAKSVVKVAKSAKAAKAPAVAPVTLKAAVKKAVQTKARASAAPVVERSVKAPAQRGARKVAKPAAPLDVTAKTKRVNPLKTRADNVATQAHAGSQTRRSQAKRDAR